MATEGRCPACMSPLAPWRRASAADSSLRGSSYSLLRCLGCGTARTALEEASARPQPTLYAGPPYAEPRTAMSAAVEPLRRLADRDRLRFFRDLRTGARVFEAGAGDGRFLALLASRGFAADGVEPEPGLWRRAVGRGARVRCLPLEQASLPDRSRDAVVAWHVLEHLEHPRDALELFRPALRSDGFIVVAVPNLGSLQARLAGNDWFHQDVPRHRTHFTVPGLRALLSRSGFETRRVAHLLVEQNALGMWQSILNRLTVEPNVAFRALKRDLGGLEPRARRRDLAISLTAGAPLAPLAAGLELAAGLARMGGTVVVTARPTA